MPSFPVRKRLLILPATVLALLISLEVTARTLHLDQREQVSIAVDASLTRLMSDGSAWGVDYLPRQFSLDDTGFDSYWGRCDFTAPGPRVLALGDSTTRQVGRLGPLPEDLDPIALGWPMLLKSHLRKDVQVCVIAEDGYHPFDQAILAERVARLWPPDLIVALWCDNDLDDEPARVMVREGDQMRIVLHNPFQRVWRPFQWPWLIQRSEAARFIGSRLGTLTGDAVDVPLDLPRERRVLDAIRRIDALPGELRAYHIPALQEDDQWGVVRTNGLAEQAGVPIFNIPLPQPRESLRILDADHIHPNRRGHELVAAAMVQGALQIVPPR